MRDFVSIRKHPHGALFHLLERGPMSGQFIVGTGPTELHAHIDVGRRVADLDHLGGCKSASVAVVDSATCDGHWSVVATVRPWVEEIKHDS